MGRKAALLGWAQAQGLATPGGFVLPADRFWEALDACGVRAQARYLEQAALRLDPRHTVGLAASIAQAMRSDALETLARADAEAAFVRLAAPRVVCRSSSAMEDGPTAAFPGVFASVLHIESPAALARAIARCWRSAFSADVMRYLVRVRAEPVDFSLAVLVQRQVEAAWYGVYVSADPLTGLEGPIADLTDAGPDALVRGAAAALQARRGAGRWTGIGDVPDLAASLDMVHEAADRLRQRLGTDVDVEFALPGDGCRPVILQCRPLMAADVAVSHATGDLVGRGCASGFVAGPAVDGRAADGFEDTTRIAVVDRLTTADYGIVFGHAGVVMEEDASPLSHVAILCRELGVPFVCGVEEARARLVGRRVAVDGRSGAVALVQDDDHAPSEVSPAPPVGPALSSIELLLRVLGEGRPDHPPLAEAERIARRYARSLGAGRIRLLPHAPHQVELERLDRFGVAIFGPDFSASKLLADLEASSQT